MLTEHAVLEVDGQNVVGMKDNNIGKVIEDAPATVTITIMPGTFASWLAREKGVVGYKKTTLSIHTPIHPRNHSQALFTST